MIFICLDCGKIMSQVERDHYECRCEACEQANHKRLQAWRGGYEDHELNKLYSVDTYQPSQEPRH